MRLSDLSIRTRLVMLGAFTNVLLIALVGVGVVATGRLNARLDEALGMQARIESTRDLVRSTQLALGREAPARIDERLEALEPRLAAIGVAADPVERLRLVYGKGAPADAAAEAGAMRDLDSLAEAIRAQGEARTHSASAAAAAHRKSRLPLLVVVAVVALAASAVVGLANAHSIVPPLAHAVRLAEAVASGDLSEGIEVRRRDELGRLLGSLKEMNASLAGIVARVQAGVQSMMDASSHMADNSTDLSSRTEQQASSLEETAASIEEMTSTVAQNAQNARTANERAAEAAAIARRGGDAVQQVVEMMQRIQASSREISEIIGLIDSIAFQTNILALNAAVEAARAGESGRGFAVVAKEVRYLAQRTAESAKRIKDLIRGAVEAVDSGAALAGDAGRTMSEVTASVGEVSTVISDIALATREQQQGIAQINQAVMELERVTQQNASMVQDSAASSENLWQMAGELERAVGFFRLGPAKAAPPQLALAPPASTLELLHRERPASV